MYIDEQDYLDMARDYEAMERQAVQDAEELRRLRSGELVTCPCDLEHARAMFKMACFYLSQHDPKFELELTDD
jgi:hypothetical protein